MIQNDHELKATIEYIARLQEQITFMRKMGMNESNYRASSSGYLSEIDKKQLEIREYFQTLPEALAA